MSREPTLAELADDFERLTVQVQRLGDRLDNAPYVRADTHEAQLDGIRQGVAHVERSVHEVKDSVKGVDASVARLQQLVLGAFGALIVAGITAVISGAAP